MTTKTRNILLSAISAGVVAFVVTKFMGKSSLTTTLQSAQTI